MYIHHKNGSLIYVITWKHPSFSNKKMKEKVKVEDMYDLFYN
jgi:hypothetical protein